MNLDDIDADLSEFYTIVVSASEITPDELDFLARSGYVAPKIDRKQKVITIFKKPV